MVIEKKHGAAAIDCNHWAALSHFRGVHFMEALASLLEAFRVEVLNELIGVRHCHLLPRPSFPGRWGVRNS
jgi:hypothetical protein